MYVLKFLVILNILFSYGAWANQDAGLDTRLVPIMCERLKNLEANDAVYRTQKFSGKTLAAIGGVELLASMPFLYMSLNSYRILRTDRAAMAGLLEYARISNEVEGARTRFKAAVDQALQIYRENGLVGSRNLFSMHLSDLPEKLPLSERETVSEPVREQLSKLWQIVRQEQTNLRHLAPRQARVQSILKNMHLYRPGELSHVQQSLEAHKKSVEEKAAKYRRSLKKFNTAAGFGLVTTVAGVGIYYFFDSQLEENQKALARTQDYIANQAIDCLAFHMHQEEVRKHGESAIRSMPQLTVDQIFGQ